MIRYCNVSLVGCFDDLILLIKGHEIIYIDVLPSFYHNITCSLVRVTSLALVFGYSCLFGVRLNFLEDYLLAYGVIYHWKVYN